MTEDPSGATERLVVARGAAAGLLLAAPGALANVVLAAQVPKPAGALNATFLVLVAGFAVAGFLAGREASHAPTRHGVLAALCAAVPVAVIGTLGRLDRGEGVAVGSVLVLVIAAALFGSLGSRPGVARRNRKLLQEDPS